MKLFKKKIDYYPEEYFYKRENKKQYIIHHYCPHTYNAGDHFVILSIRKHLRKYLQNCIFVPKPIANNRGWGKPIGLRGNNIKYSNEFADAVMLGGSDQYNNWSPRITSEEIEKLAPPLFLIGLGVSSKGLNKKPYIKEKKYFSDILATNKKAMLSSVRDKTTYNFLKDLGYKNSIITGCPALFLKDNPIQLNQEKSNIMFTFPYPLLHKTKNKEKIKKYQKIYETTKKIISYIENIGLEAVIVCHDDRDVPNAQKIFPNYEIFFSNYPQDYIKKYSEALIVIGSRLHATILVSGMGIPSININLDLRGVSFSQTFGLENWNLNLDVPNLEDKIKERIEILLKNDLSAFGDFIEIRNDYKKIFNSFMQNTAEIIKKS